MTLIVLPATDDADAEAPADPDGDVVPGWEQAVATIKATKATMAIRADRGIAFPLCGPRRPNRRGSC